MRGYRCGNCAGDGHNRRSCTKAVASTPARKALDLEDIERRASHVFVHAGSALPEHVSELATDAKALADSTLRLVAEVRELRRALKRQIEAWRELPGGADSDPRNPLPRIVRLALRDARDALGETDAPAPPDDAVTVVARDGTPVGEFRFHGCKHERTWSVRWRIEDSGGPRGGEPLAGEVCSTCGAERCPYPSDGGRWTPWTRPGAWQGEHVEPLAPHPLALAWERDQ